MRITALIVEDEPIARRKLRRLLADFSWIVVLPDAEDGLVAVRQIDALLPDLVFLDVQMPGMSGLEVLEQIQHRPHVIFTTAFDRYAVTAFELRALDYLVKPFGRERLTEAVERVRTVLAEGHPEIRAEPPDVLSAGKPIDRVYVRQRDGTVVPITVARIERFEARGDYVGVWSDGSRYLVNLPLRDIEEWLDAAQFVRIHRSHIVNLDFIDSVTPTANSRLAVRMRDGATITASRARTPQLRKLVKAALG